MSKLLRHPLRWGKKIGTILILLVVVAACAPAAGTTTAAPAATTAGSTAADAASPGMGGSAIGFIFVGPKDDFGYNQAAYMGSEAVEKEFPNYKILRAENVPENQEAERVMENMIRQGAKIIFPTSYGHLDPALEVAARHPEVIFMHQGGLKTAPNLGTYFGTIWQAVYLAGVAAGHMTKTNKLGYVVSFPIPQVLLNVNAFELGAQSVNPDVETTVVFTASWCDPGQQAEAANSLIAQGVDVLTQHQDCTKTIIETAERAGVMSVGYHADASSLAPNGWVVGSVWDRGPTYTDIVKTIDSGKWKDSAYTGRYRADMSTGAVKLTAFGKNVPQDVQDDVLAVQKTLLDGSFNPFTGPIYDQEGKVRIEKGITPSVDELESADYLIKGVIGSIPQ